MSQTTDEVRGWAYSFGMTLGVVLLVVASFLLVAIVGAWSHLYVRAFITGWRALS